MRFTYFEIHLVEHCNLKCQCCDNFSPLAEEEFIDVKVFNKQMKRMAEIAGNQIASIRLLGGEPLLHPELNKLMSNARKYFPKAKLLLTTNAVLLSEMKKKFWTTCHDNDITIEITYYPINLDRDKYTELAKENDVKLIYFDNIKDKKISHRNPINDKGDQPIDKNYQRCYQRHRCMSLKDGKVYPCTCIPNIYHFNKYFDKNLPVTEQDYIDIFKVENVKEIEQFLDKPVPFCAYCNVVKRTNGKPWERSKFELSEWFDE